MAAYYNEIDAFAAQWLRNLIAAGHIAAGDVDERDIREVNPDDLRGYTQCHFFAGIGGWSLALRLAGWDDARPVWTGSCPCQPFSAAGKRKGTADERHLWPEFRRLIAECAPAVVFGEQVASKDGRVWFAGVRADLEALGYAAGGGDLCSAGIGAPNIRQRLWWVADADQAGQREFAQRDGGEITGQPASLGHDADGCGGTSGLADPASERWDGRQLAGEASAPAIRSAETQERRAAGAIEFAGLRPAGRLGDAIGARLEIGRGQRSDDEPQCAPADRTGGHAYGFWERYDAIPCLDGKARRVEPGSFPLAFRVPGRVGRLRAYGNAINPWLAAEFIAAYGEVA